MRQHREVQAMTSWPVSHDKLMLILLPKTHLVSFYSLKWTCYSHSETREIGTLKTNNTLLWYTFKKTKKSQQTLQLGFRSPNTLFAPLLDQGEGQTGVLIGVDGQLDKI